MIGWLPWVVTVWLFVVGLYGVISSRNLVHAIICLTVVQSSTYVLLLSIGYKFGGRPPVFSSSPPGPRSVDPVVQALALTDVVVGATVTALLLALAVQIFKRRQSLDPRELARMRG